MPSLSDNLAESWRRWVVSLAEHSKSNVRRGFRNPFITVTERERTETRKLFEEVKRLFEASRFAGDDAADDFMFQVIVEGCDRAGVTPSIPLGEAFWGMVRGFLTAEGSIFGFPEVDLSAELTLEEGVALRDYLHRKKRFLSDPERLLEIWREKIIRLIEGTVAYLPASAFLEDEEDETAEAPKPSFSAPLIDLCEKPAELIERCIVTMFDDDIVNARLFDSVRLQLDRNGLAASGIPFERRHESSKAIILPTQARCQSNVELVDTYLAGTPFTALFECRLPFRIPFPVRFEHTLVVGGSGHGKTQLLQLLIHHDLAQAKEDGRSIVIIDSQGDLIRTISHLAEFDPEAKESLAGRLLIVDPNDVEYPVSLNMFDWNRERLAQFSPLDREKVLNATIELYEYLFGALLGAELTQKQGVVFKYLARLMMEIPEATIHTLRELMENGEPFRPYMAKLPGSARSFFETRFFDRSFNETKKQILTRLWGVLSNATLERMFSSPKNKVDIFDATNAGKIILINTAKELLKQEGCAIFGRFFIALIAQAAIQRAALSPHQRRSTFVYIDEAQDYFDQNIEQLLNQARKYRFGLVLAHQNLDQLSVGLRASIMANTSIKFAGGVSAKDANLFASEMRCSSEFIQGIRKRGQETAFACYIRNLTPQAVEVTLPLGYVEAEPTISDASYRALIDQNRSRYCGTLAELEALARTARQTTAPTTRPVDQRGETSHVTQAAGSSPQAIQRTQPAPPVLPQTPDVADVAKARARPSRLAAPRELPPLGRGGKQHKYLQQIIKQAAEERNFRAVIEESILDGGGRVDVALTLGKRKIACEISVTTEREQELGNIEKCLAAGFAEVILVSAQARHLTSLQKFIVPQLEEAERERVRFLLIEDFIAYLDEISATIAPTEEMIRGYKVRVTRQVVSAEEAKARRETLARVIARSLGRQKNDPD